MKYTIEDLRNGKVAAENDGTKGELNEVLRMAFPRCAPSSGRYMYYKKYGSVWGCTDETTLPTQSVKDFLVEELTFPRKMLVWNDIEEDAQPRFVLGKFNACYVCVDGIYEKDYLDGKEYSAYTCLNAKELPPKKTITREVTDEQEKMIDELLNSN